MPLLYATPFELLESNHHWSSQERTRRHASLLYLLMNCCGVKEHAPEDDTTQGRGGGGGGGGDIWKDMPPVCPTFEAANKLLKHPLVDYLSAYHHHYLRMNLSSTFPTLFPNIQRHPLPLLSDLLSTSSSSQTHMTITMYTRNEIERRFLLHGPGQIRTISLPIQRLGAFKTIGPQLSRLVRFELYGVSWHFNLETAIEFLQQHGRLYGTIRELKVAGPNDVRLLQKPRLDKVVKEIRSPRVIDLSRYKEASRDMNLLEIQHRAGLKALLFDLEYVPKPQQVSQQQVQEQQQQQTYETIPEAARLAASGVTHAMGLTAASCSRPLSDDVHELDLIKNECTGLTTLQIGVQSATAFAWAKDRYDADHHYHLSEQHTHLHPYRHQQHPFKTLRLSANCPGTIKQVVEDCVYAFRDTLEDLTGVALKLWPSPEFRTLFGWSWTLPHLSVLTLRGELAAWFDMESLRFCPRLQELHLTLHPYSPTEPDHLERLVLAPGLKVLALRGRWILTDRVMVSIGEGLNKLSELVLDGCQYNSRLLTEEGIVQGLDKMRQLRKLEVECGSELRSVLMDYKEARPEVTIRIPSEDVARPQDPAWARPTIG
ncbi:hypothetical protein EDD11_007617 [Mortierella claussenii]|nr:hypothetical protein EDD11_007617 [Mortierella claussenii]